ncbi:putative quinol monooxygenase [uncultured Microbacterium sp.]|uniref:putative quinol monooxygenase n=1 Tax=uncultured Microbacterium sp. TaxID=191216 RepID=UPI0026081CE8|nr:putative quinol monooxygenase [uncultured Microbacterium sp.]
MNGRHLYAEFQAVPGAGDAVASLVAGYRREVRAEPGNVRFDAHRLHDEQERFFVYEEYADDEAFASHLSSAANAAFNAALSPLVVGGGSTLTWLDGIEDAAANAGSAGSAA